RPRRPPLDGGRPLRRSPSREFLARRPGRGLAPARAPRPPLGPARAERAGRPLRAARRPQARPRTRRRAAPAPQPPPPHAAARLSSKIGATLDLELLRSFVRTHEHGLDEDSAARLLCQLKENGARRRPRLLRRARRWLEAPRWKDAAFESSKRT